MYIVKIWKENKITKKKERDLKENNKAKPISSFYWEPNTSKKREKRIVNQREKVNEASVRFIHHQFRHNPFLVVDDNP